MLRAENLKKAFGRTAALDGLNLTVPDGSLYGLVGPNGAGKTTTIRIIVGLLPPDGGRVTADGTDLVREPRGMRDRIGYMPDNFGVYDNMTAEEYMEFFAACHGLTGLKARKRCRALLEQAGLGDKADYYAEGLSRGMKQRLCLARALIHNPSLLIMDEPTAGMDPRARHEFKEILKELRAQGKTVLISSHILSELAEICTDVGIMDQGRMVAEGSLKEILERMEVTAPLLISASSGRQEALRILRENPLAETVSIRDEDILVGFSGNRQDEAALLRQLLDAGVPVHRFVREQGNLESVFMQITDHEEEMVLIHEDR